jgi:hypothetical protein
MPLAKQYWLAILLNDLVIACEEDSIVIFCFAAQGTPF